MTDVLYKKRVSREWTLVVISSEGGLIPNVEMKATRRDGHGEVFDVSLWPTGWRILRVGLTIPKQVRKAAVRIAAEGTGLAPASQAVI